MENKSLYEEALNWYKENATPNEKGNVWNLTVADYKNFMKQHGFTESMLEKKKELDSAILNAGYTFISEKVSEKIKEAKKSGEDPKDIRIKLKTPTESGRIVHQMDSYKKYPNPKSPGDAVEIYGATTVKMTFSRTLDKEIMEKAAASVKAAFK